MPALSLTIIILSVLAMFIGMGISKYSSNKDVQEGGISLCVGALMVGGCGSAILLGYYMYNLLAPLVN